MICNACGEDKVETEFYKETNGKPCRQCKDCRRTAAKIRYQKKPHSRNSEKRREEHLWLAYKITQSEYLKMAEAQDWRCAICHEKTKLHVDHDEDTEIIRGLLCYSCNTGIGRFKHNPNLLRKAINYLNRKTESDWLTSFFVGLGSTSRDENDILLYTYGITVEQREELARLQNYCCAICGDKTKLEVDHNHKTGAIRGLLSLNCNSGLSSFKESTETMRKAIEYLEIKREVDLYKILCRNITGC